MPDLKTRNNLQEQFKSGMQLLASTVTIISTNHNGKRAGLAATAVSSLTVDPPQLLVCINQSSRTYEQIKESQHFVVNLVPDTLTDIVNVFSSNMDQEEKFQTAGNWRKNQKGQPVLSQALASFSCKVSEQVTSSSHAVFFGLVEEIQTDETRSPLIYARQKFSKLIPVQQQ